jgi:hypothetical protein
MIVTSAAAGTRGLTRSGGLVGCGVLLLLLLLLLQLHYQATLVVGTESKQITFATREKVYNRNDSQRLTE